MDSLKLRKLSTLGLACNSIALSSHSSTIQELLKAYLDSLGLTSDTLGLASARVGSAAPVPPHMDRFELNWFLVDSLGYRSNRNTNAKICQFVGPFEITPKM